MTQPLGHVSQPPAAPRERLHWVDFAKAVAILLVVLYHVSIRRIAAAHSTSLMLGAVGMYAALAYLIYVRGTELPLSITITVTGLVSAVTLSAWATRYTPVRTAARYLAARTLPIYLIHPFLLALIAGSLILAGDGQSVLSQSLPVLNAVAVPALTILLTAASLLAYDFLLRTPLRILFRFP